MLELLAVGPFESSFGVIFNESVFDHKHIVRKDVVRQEIILDSLQFVIRKAAEQVFPYQLLVS